MTPYILTDMQAAQQKQALKNFLQPEVMKVNSLPIIPAKRIFFFVPTTGTSSFPWVKRPGRGVDHPPSPSPKVKERVELYLYFPSELLWSVLG